MKHDRMVSAYVQALRRCPSFDDGNVLARALPEIERATEQQIDDLVAAVNDNDQVRHSFGFSGNKRSRRGTDPHLHRLGPRRFVRGDDDVIAQAAGVKQREAVEDEIPLNARHMSKM